MLNFKIGDLIAKKIPNNKKPVQIGIVVKDKKSTFEIKWIWYDKDYFMEKEGNIFRELNKEVLLRTQQFNRKQTATPLYIINDSYNDGN